MKKVIILSGVSGSGKSTLIAHYLVNHKSTFKIVSADNYFYKGADYCFDPSKLGEAHAQCFREFIEGMTTNWKDDDHVIFVDNTNTTEVEIAPYVLGAQAFGYDVEIQTIFMNHMDRYLELFAKRNAHGVPLRGIEQQYKNLCNRKLPPWWNHSEVSPVV